jgi:hypothetical protein
MICSSVDYNACFSAFARPMGIGPVSNFLEDRCGPIVVCLRSAGPRTFRKVYHEIKTRGY